MNLLPYLGIAVSAAYSAVIASVDIVFQGVWLLLTYLVVSLNLVSEALWCVYVENIGTTLPLVFAAVTGIYIADRVGARLWPHAGKRVFDLS